jgi:uncharacterized protein YcfL
MRKLIAIFILSLFLFVGCEQASSVVAPDNNTNTELEKNDKPLDSLQKDEDDNPRP